MFRNLKLLHVIDQVYSLNLLKTDNFLWATPELSANIKVIMGKILIPIDLLTW
jgi:hypothetical protein